MLSKCQKLTLSLLALHISINLIRKIDYLLKSKSMIWIWKQLFWSSSVLPSIFCLLILKSYNWAKQNRKRWQTFNSCQLDKKQEYFCWRKFEYTQIYRKDFLPSYLSSCYLCCKMTAHSPPVSWHGGHSGPLKRPFSSCWWRNRS